MSGLPAPRRGLHGQPLTPEDVVFSFAYHRDQKLPATIIAQPVPDIAEVRATGSRTVEFLLSKPVATFLQFGGAGAIPSSRSTSGRR